MCYQDANPQGAWPIYQDCKTQLALWGNQGSSILLGWIAQGTSYYTDDETGLERYIEHCLVAQAAGMTEIFHAPIYRLQGKWGDDAILRLHQELNEKPKRTFTISVPPFKFNADFLNDFAGNFNKPWVCALLYLIIVLRIGEFSFKKQKKFVSVSDSK
jgi:hypothetical protein